MTYAVTAYTNALQRVWCWLLEDRLVISYEPVSLEFGPVIRDTFDAANADPHLFDVRIIPAN